MAKVIEVVVTPTGETTMQTKGYAGSDCQQASKWLEKADRPGDRRPQDARVLSARNCPATGGERVNLTAALTDYINAAFAGIWVETREADEAEREIIRHAQQKKWRIAVWDVANGLRLPGSSAKRLKPAPAIRWQLCVRYPHWLSRMELPSWWFITSTGS